MLDDEHAERLMGRFGEPVREWIATLDERVATAAERFGVRPVAPPVGGSTSVVVPCEAAVLKLTPEVGLAADEATALGAWAAVGAVVTLLGDDGEGTLLLERLRPGSPLEWPTLDEVVPVLAGLWSVPRVDVGLPPLAERIAFLAELTERRAGGQDAVGAAMRRDATRRLAELAAEPGHAGVVHGDLHPGNVLVDERGPVAIDPRPSLGDRTFDLVAWVMLDPIDVGALEARVAALANALPGLDPGRLRAWVDASLPLDAAVEAARAPGAERTARLLALVGR